MNVLLFNFQFGFREGYFTEYATLETVETLKSQFDDQKITCGIFLDFSKAFNTINHHILLEKLYKYGITRLPNAWFLSYITNRKQNVKVGNTESSLKTIRCGVPQGSTLGPLLFLLYINDLQRSSKKLTFRIFADDTNMFYSSKDPRTITLTKTTYMLHICDVYVAVTYICQITVHICDIYVKVLK